MELLAAVKQLQDAANGAAAVLADIQDAEATRRRLHEEIRSLTEHTLKLEMEIKAAQEAVAAARGDESALRARIKAMQATLATL